MARPGCVSDSLIQTQKVNRTLDPNPVESTHQLPPYNKRPRGSRLLFIRRPAVLPLPLLIPTQLPDSARSFHRRH
jgi:hypothetical protein